MSHLKAISRSPASAQSGVCSNITNDYQAILCFILQIMTLFVLPLAQTKSPSEPTPDPDPPFVEE